MKRVGFQADTAAAEVKATEKKLALFGNRVDIAIQTFKGLASDIDATSAQLQEAFQQEDEFSLEIFKKFSKYEKVALKLQKADLDDVTRLLNPDMRVRISVFVYITFFDNVDMSAYSDESTAIEVIKHTRITFSEML